MPLRVMVTGHLGYLGTTLVRLLKESGHQVVGVDCGLYECFCVGSRPSPVDCEIHKDIRDLTLSDFDSFDAIIHLAALSNDSLGKLSSRLTYEINYRSSLRLAQLAKQSGVPRFLYASSCSVYGAAGPDAVLDERAPLAPASPYAESKVCTERGLARFADCDFCPVYLRIATAYGLSPCFRADLVVNNLTAWACATGRVLLQSDGTASRPLVHVEDVAQALIAMLLAPRETVCDQAVNIGRPGANYQIRDVAGLVRQAVPGSVVEYSSGAASDPRCYRVDFTKMRQVLPGFEPRWTVDEGIEQLIRAFREWGLTPSDVQSPKFLRIKRVQQLINDEQLDRNFRWIPHFAHL